MEVTFSVSIQYVYTYMLPFQHINININTLKMILSISCRFKWKADAQAIYLNPLAVAHKTDLLFVHLLTKKQMEVTHLQAYLMD